MPKKKVLVHLRSALILYYDAEWALIVPADTTDEELSALARQIDDAVLWSEFVKEESCSETGDVKILSVRDAALMDDEVHAVLGRDAKGKLVIELDGDTVWELQQNGDPEGKLSAECDEPDDDEEA
jgi:hypothetical protein